MNDQKSTSIRLWVLHMFGVAIVYGVLGNLSLLLAIPPGYATAIWPPSGVALAAVLVYGYRVWPGVLVGSFLVNFSTGLDTSSALAILEHLPVPIGIAIGAALQSVTGVYCLRRFAGFPNRLATEREVFLFLFWGGAVSCIVSAGVGASVLWGADIIPSPNFFVNFGTWWIGDAIGVFVFTPLVLVWASRPRDAWVPRRLTVTGPIVIALALTVAAVSYGSSWERQRIKLEFDQQVFPLAPALAKTLNSYLGVLYSLEGYYAASSDITREEFKTFVERSFASFTGIQALSWNPRISNDERSTFERRTQQEGFADFRITERNAEGQIIAANERPEYISVHFIEPFYSNVKAFGFDVASNPTRLKAMELARDLARPIATGRITLVQETGKQFGVLVFMPVYRNNLPHDTLADRRLNLAGYMVGVFRGGDIVKAALQDSDLEGITYRIIDDSASAQEKFLIQNHPPENAVKTLVEKGLFGGSLSIGRTFPIEFGGRQWIFEVSPSQEYITSHRHENAWLILIGGMILTGLVGSFVMVVSGRSELFRNLVAARTFELEQSERHVRAIVDNALDGIITINDHGIILTANPGAQTIFGYSHEDMIGQNISMLMPEPHRSAHDGYISNFLSSGEAKIIGTGREVQGQRKDGIYVTLELQVSEFTVGGNHMFLGIVSDISERKQAEKMKDEFISTVSHELRTPLTSIKGALGLIRSGAIGELPKKLGSMLDIAYNNSDRLVCLINDILDIEKIAAGKMKFHMEPTDLGLLLEQAIEANKGYGLQHNVSFVLADIVAGAKVRGDHGRLMQVMVNLMSNAAKFSPKGGTVKVSLSGHEKGFRVSVSDHGPGIPEDFRNKIFGKFLQADSSDTRQKGGTGLGLNITKSIVEQHGGVIGFDTETGKGTTFFFDLPAFRADKVVAAEMLGRHSQYRILVCEDDPALSSLLELMLKQDGFVTDTAMNAAQAEALLEQNAYDAMVLNLGLPDKDGITFMQELRQKPKTKDLPIIVISANASEGAAEINGDAIGVIDWIQPPIDIDRLSEGLRRAISSSFNERPRILHVEDDPDIVAVISSLVGDLADVVSAETLSRARGILENEPFDLVILDLMLPDGDGEELLPLMNKVGHKSTPVIVFSVKDTNQKTLGNIKAVLVKSRTSNETLLATIRSFIKIKDTTDTTH